MTDAIVATPFEDLVSNARKEIKTVAEFVKSLKESRNVGIPIDDKEDRGEVLANLTLAYRHLEDAAMRLGKVIQAHDGGVSVYDK